MPLVKMTETKKGQEAGQEVKTYVAGETYEMQERLASVFISQGWASLAASVPEIPLPPVPVVPPLPGAVAPKDYTAEEIRVLPMKQLKALVDERALSVDTKGMKSQPVLAELVITALGAQ